MIAEAIAMALAAKQVAPLCVTNATQESFWVNVSGTAIGGDVITTYEYKHLNRGVKHCIRLDRVQYEVRIIPGDDIDRGTLYLPPYWAGESCAYGDTSKGLAIRVVSANEKAEFKFDCQVVTSQVEG